MKARKGFLLLLLILPVIRLAQPEKGIDPFIFHFACAEEATSSVNEASEKITLSLVPKSRIHFTNVLQHLVEFDAEVQNAEWLSMQLLDDEKNQVSFRTYRQLLNKSDPGRRMAYPLARGQQEVKGLNIVFPADMKTGFYTIRVTATAPGKEEVSAVLRIEVMKPAPLKMNLLKQVHEMILGTDENVPTEVADGMVRYVCQDPGDALFVKEYWASKDFDLRSVANQKCTRAVMSMALSYLGIDCTPVAMSELLRSKKIFYTYDAVCEKLGNVRRTEGNLETLWTAYEAGEASPVMLHFTYSDGGMHGVLLVARDQENPDLYYAITSGQRVNTLKFPDGVYRDIVIPLLIENGEIGERIQSPLLDRYHRGKIDQIWQWERTDVGDH